MSASPITSEPAATWQMPSPRKTGIILVILTESALFSIFVVAFLYYLGKSLTGPYPHEVLHFPWLGSFLLFSSSGTIVVAERMLKRGVVRDFLLWWGITWLLGLGFILFTAYEWHELIYKEGLTISTNLFGSTYYALVGLHASHVVVGLLLLGLIFIAMFLGKIQHRHHEHVEMISWYWHFVDAIWVVVVTVVYIIGANS